MKDRWWNDTDKGKPKYVETQTKNLSQCPRFHNKSHKEWPGIEHRTAR